MFCPSLSGLERLSVLVGEATGGSAGRRGRRSGRCGWTCVSRTAILAGNVLFLQLTETRHQWSAGGISPRRESTFPIGLDLDAGAVVA
ncbi:hypothetical protein HMPREF1979_00541 [Actinomyces johnsonii F0542]|uniref:Uncharacterized protein n=1 Tax=Actinomyces johnsonii F0542 TaxID=1321818 RepID=U1QTX6_9ACTO|nr:hypothetical protein HMPREF1979_00541 [Actinomyces johnsonii F0542]